MQMNVERKTINNTTATSSSAEYSFVFNSIVNGILFIYRYVEGGTF